MPYEASRPGLPHLPHLCEVRGERGTQDRPSAEGGGNLIVLFPKGKTYQYGESRMAVITGDSTLMINPVRVIDVYMSRLEGVAGNKGGLLFPALASSSKGDLSLDKPASYDSVLKQFK